MNEETTCRNNCNTRGCFSTLPPACHCPHVGMSCRDKGLRDSEDVWREATKRKDHIDPLGEYSEAGSMSRLWKKVEEIIKVLNERK